VYKRVCLFCLALSLFLSGCIKKKEVVYVSDETLVKSQLVHFEDAVKQEKLELFSDYYSRDKLTVYPFWQEEVLNSWDEVVEYWKWLFDEIKITEFALSSVTVSTSGRLAYVKGNWEMIIEKRKLVKKKKQYETLLGRYSAVFENHEGNWQAVQEHMSLPSAKLPQ
jgi:ketosteroid isomerase-like protein